MFGVHCVGGITGALLTGIFADASIGGTAGSLTQFLAQCEGVTVTIVYGSIMSYLILKFIDVVVGLRVDDATEQAGLDLAIHGEKLH